jgi:hypothetical protein
MGDKLINDQDHCFFQERTCMPVRLTVGISKKLGLPAYSSVGASCQLELELDARLIDRDPAAFQEEIRRAYLLCREAVAEELAPYAAPAQEEHAEPDEPKMTGNGNGHGGNGACRTLPKRNGQPVVPAFACQLEYLRTLAARTLGVSPAVLDLLSTKLYGAAPKELDARDASGLIDTLQQVRSGQLDLEGLLECEGP